MKKHAVLLVLSGLCLYSVLALIEARVISRQLNEKNAQLIDEVRELQDKQRNLQLEVATLTDYKKVREAAVQSGMKEPSVADGTWVRLK